MRWDGTLHVGNLCNNNYKLCLALRKVGVDAHYVHFERLARVHPLSDPGHYDPDFDPGAEWVHPVAEISRYRGLQLAYEMFHLACLIHTSGSRLWPHGQTDFPAYLWMLTRQYTAHSTGSDLRVHYRRRGWFGTLIRRGYRRARLAFYNNIDLHTHELARHTTTAFLPNTIDPQAYPQQPVARPVRSRLRVLLASRVTLTAPGDVKGTGVFLQALQMLHERGGAIDVVCASEDPQAEILRAACDHLAPAIRLDIEPFRHDRRSYLTQIQQADVVIDQFGYGAMGGTAIDCFILGRIALVRLDTDAHQACYGEPSPLGELATAKQICDALVRLMDMEERRRLEVALQEWVIRHHRDTVVAGRFLRHLEERDVHIHRGAER